MITRSPFAAVRRYLSASGLAMPSQRVRFSSTRRSNEYSEGSVLSSQYAMRTATLNVPAGASSHPFGTVFRRRCVRANHENLVARRGLRFYSHRPARNRRTAAARGDGNHQPEGTRSRGMSDQHEKRLSWLAFVYDSALKHGVFRPADVISHATPEVLAKDLPKELLIRIFEVAFDAGKLTPEGMLGVAPPSTLVKHIGAGAVRAFELQAGRAPGGRPTLKPPAPMPYTPETHITTETQAAPPPPPPFVSSPPVPPPIPSAPVEPALAAGGEPAARPAG